MTDRSGAVRFASLLVLLPSFLAVSSAQEVNLRDDDAVLRFGSFAARRVTVIGEGGGYFPVAVRMKDGRIAAVLRGGGSHIDVRGRLDIVFSSDDGETWTPPRILVDGPNDDRNPAVGVAADGTVVVAYVIAHGYPPNKTEEEMRRIGIRNFLRGSGIYVIRSRDHGATWDAPTMIDLFKGPYPSPYGKIVTLDDGSLLMPLYTADNFKNLTVPAGTSFAYTVRSTDNGRTWGDVTLLGAGLDETALLQTRGKDLLAVMRGAPVGGPPGVALYLARSSDRGRSWSAPEALTREQEIPADLVELPDGRIVLCHGERNPPMGVQAMVSSDGGRTFNRRDKLALAWRAPHRDTGYPTSVLRKDGQVLTLYYQMDDPATHPQSAKCKAVVWRPPADWR